MQPILNFFAVINTLGVLQCVLTALALFSIKTGNRSANLFLGLFLFVLALFIANYIMWDTRFHLIFPYIAHFGIPVDFVLMQPFYFYVRSLTQPTFRFNIRHTWHFIPFLIALIIILPDVFQSTAAKRSAILAVYNKYEEPFILRGIIALITYAYLFTSYWLLKVNTLPKDTHLSQNVYSKIRWLKSVIVIIIIANTVSMFFDSFPSLTSLDDYITPFFMTVVVYSMAYIGIRQSEIFTTENLFARRKKYEKSVLTDEMAEDVLSKLKHTMEKEKLFTDSLLSLPKLADKLKITTHLLSQILNERLNRNFFNYVSEYRVNEAKHRLLQPDAGQITMLELAYEVGFNSLSAFNTAFKKHAGMSPSEYKKRNGASH